VPQHGYLASSGRDWECERSYRRSSRTCEVFTVPANAHLGYSGNDWTCNPGYRRFGESCAQDAG
jgi:hypothetical protein